ncbi:MAG TPA: hypothetical protein VGO33_14355 [Gemmatimonadaceae bacterium]|nr:hypothetical protein [Gemmatimonadaceae bacterium]
MSKSRNVGAIRVLVSVLAAASLAACSDGAGPHIVQPPPPTIHVLTLETYDGSGQAVHPDAATTPAGWDVAGGSEQLFVTPYPYGDASKENPSLYTSRSFKEWLVPSGVMNPIARPDAGYLSDPDQLFNPETNELWLYYRAVTSENQIFLIRGAGPSRWSAPTLVASAPNHSIVSPTVVRRGAGDWYMWSVNSGASGCTASSTTVELRRSTDGISWSAPVAVDLHEIGVSAWHIDVEWIPAKQEFWATYNVKVPGSCTTAALHFASSADGLAWTPAPTAALSRGVIPEFDDIVYRASLEYDPTLDNITLWYSGARYENGHYTWRVATERLSAADFFTRILAPPPPGTGVSPTTTPPLTDADAP